MTCYIKQTSAAKTPKNKTKTQCTLWFWQRRYYELPHVKHRLAIGILLYDDQVEGLLEDRRVVQIHDRLMMSLKEAHRPRVSVTWLARYQLLLKHVQKLCVLPVLNNNTRGILYSICYGRRYHNVIHKLFQNGKRRDSAKYLRCAIKRY